MKEVRHLLLFFAFVCSETTSVFPFSFPPTTPRWAFFFRHARRKGPSFLPPCNDRPQPQLSFDFGDPSAPIEQRSVSGSVYRGKTPLTSFPLSFEFFFPLFFFFLIRSTREKPSSLVLFLASSPSPREKMALIWRRNPPRKFRISLSFRRPSPPVLFMVLSQR